MSAPETARYASRWDVPHAEGLSALDRLVYRSNLLGADRSLANWGGGNTSTKTVVTDHTGKEVRALFVKGSGTDLATVERAGFAALRLDDLDLLFERETMTDAEMIDYLLRSALDPRQPRPSIETLLHAFIPAPEVDHTHPDAAIALTSAPPGRELAAAAFGAEAIWIDYIRPGFRLARRVAQAVRSQPEARFVLLEKHGLVTWGDTSEESYEATLEAVQRALDALAAVAPAEPLGALAVPPLRPEARARALAELLPRLRGRISRERRHVLEVDTSQAALDFVGRERSAELSRVGAACPDHLVNTKAKPLFLTDAPLDEQLDAYEAWYRGYYESNLDDESRAFPADPAGPRVVLAPELGLITAGTNAAAARVSNELYRRAMEVIRLAAGAGGFTSLSEPEAFAVEYWPLERYKLTLAPTPRELEGRIAFVTGAASGIGRAIAERLAAEGAHVAIADIDTAGAGDVTAVLCERYGVRRALAVPVDVTDEESVGQAYMSTILAWGGIDIVVSNAGVAVSAPLADTTREVWDRNFDVLARGYFLVAAQAIEIMRRQGIGGSIVFVGSKNALAAGKNTAAYSAAKAAELHLARCLAEEAGPSGIRINSVNPDAVLRGSAIWNTEWRAERAKAYGIPEEKLEEYYRDRTTLRVAVCPEDVAEAALFFASDRSAKSTGNIVNVDGGVATAYPR
jgi:rhamnulose-1-phosphate aldolase/alcohol dehydrogenase